MLKKLTAILLSCSLTYSYAQVMQTYEQKGELGISAGVGHYFGDLDPNIGLRNPKFAAGAFYQRQFNNYVGFKMALNYVFLGYSDAYSNNEVQRIRNLSFNTDVWEASVTGQFNFFKYYPGSEYNFTPYVGLGIGAFYYNPYTYYNGQKIYLRPLGTEGENLPGHKQYSDIAVCFPISLGVKYSLNYNINLFAEFCYRFTTTDYIDDVSGTYQPQAFATGSPASYIQDRSYIYGTPIGIQGRQRGNSSQKDSYATFEVGISFNLDNYHCPKY